MSENAISVINKIQFNQDKQCLMWINAREYLEKFRGTIVNLYNERDEF